MAKKPISKKRKAFRRILQGVAVLAFIFAAFMSFFYIGHKRGYIEHEDIAPTVFATDVYLYQTKAYWSDDPHKFKIASRLIDLGLFDRQYYYAGREMMTSLAEDGYEPAEEVIEIHFAQK